jgi:hypothetical protein
MKINKILLTDNGDDFYTDLITFQKDTTKEEISDAINKCMKELIDEYTNEDIYEYLDKYIGIKSIEFLDYERFYY